MRIGVATNIDQAIRMCEEIDGNCQLYSFEMHTGLLNVYQGTEWYEKVDGKLSNTTELAVFAQSILGSANDFFGEPEFVFDSPKFI
jgi:hypothetical protein